MEFRHLNLKVENGVLARAENVDINLTYVFLDKMRSKNVEKVVEPILNFGRMCLPESIMIFAKKYEF